MATNSFQLVPITPGMTYDDFLIAVQKNLSILLNAYISGANVVQFVGDPGINGDYGQRGASMIHISDESLIDAVQVPGVVLPDGYVPENVLQDAEHTLNSVQAVLNSGGIAVTTLFQDTEIITSITDIRQYDTLMFSTSTILYVTMANNAYTVHDASMHVDINIDYNHIIQEVLSQLAISESQIVSEQSSIVTYNDNGVVRTTYLPNSINTSELYTITNKLLYLSMHITNTDASTVEGVTLVAGTNLQLKAIYEALNALLSASESGSEAVKARAAMPSGSKHPAQFVIQSSINGTAPNELATDTMVPDKRFGIVFVDMSSLNRTADGSDLQTGKATFTSFGAISKAKDGLWIMSNCDTSDAYGKIYLSKRRYQLIISGLHKVQCSAKNLTVTGLTTNTYGTEGNANDALNEVVYGNKSLEVSGDAIEQTGAKTEVINGNKNATIVGDDYNDIAGKKTEVIHGGFEKSVYIDTIAQFIDKVYKTESNVYHIIDNTGWVKEHNMARTTKEYDGGISRTCGTAISNGHNEETFYGLYAERLKGIRADVPNHKLYHTIRKYAIINNEYVVLEGDSNLLETMTADGAIVKKVEKYANKEAYNISVLNFKNTELNTAINGSYARLDANLNIVFDTVEQLKAKQKLDTVFSDAVSYRTINPTDTNLPKVEDALETAIAKLTTKLCQLGIISDGRLKSVGTVSVNHPNTDFDIENGLITFRHSTYDTVVRSQGMICNNSQNFDYAKVQTGESILQNLKIRGLTTGTTLASAGTYAVGLNDTVILANTTSDSTIILPNTTSLTSGRTLYILNDGAYTVTIQVNDTTSYPFSGDTILYGTNTVTTITIAPNAGGVLLIYTGTKSWYDASDNLIKTKDVWSRFVL